MMQEKLLNQKPFAVMEKRHDPICNINRCSQLSAGTFWLNVKFMIKLVGALALSLFFFRPLFATNVIDINWVRLALENRVNDEGFEHIYKTPLCIIGTDTNRPHRRLTKQVIALFQFVTDEKISTFWVDRIEKCPIESRQFIRFTNDPYNAEDARRDHTYIEQAELAFGVSAMGEFLGFDTLGHVISTVEDSEVIFKYSKIGLLTGLDQTSEIVRYQKYLILQELFHFFSLVNDMDANSSTFGAKKGTSIVQELYPSPEFDFNQTPAISIPSNWDHFMPKALCKSDIFLIVLISKSDSNGISPQNFFDFMQGNMELILKESQDIIENRKFSDIIDDC
jgi:hypothetical protein